MIPSKYKPLALLLLAGTAMACARQGHAEDIVVAYGDPGSAQRALSSLPPCSASNYDAARDLFTIRTAPPAVSKVDGDLIAAKGRDTPRDTRDVPVRQQCLLTVGARGSAGLTEGYYTVYHSGGGDGGAGGTARYNGGGGGGASAQQNRERVYLRPGQYMLTIGAGGPGGVACRDTLGGGPGWPGAPTSLVSLADGRTVVGTAGADAWQRPTRRQLEAMKGPMDGHGGSGPNRAAGGHGGVNDPARSFGAADGQVNPASWTRSEAGDNGTGERPRIVAGIGAGGGGGAGLGNGGDGAGRNAIPAAPALAPLTAQNDVNPNAQSAPKPPARVQTQQVLAEVGGLGAGGGGGMGEEYRCTAGGAGGAGYMAFRRA